MSHQPIFYDLGATDTIVRDLVRLLAAVIAGGLIEIAGKALWILVNLEGYV